MDINSLLALSNKNSKIINDNNFKDHKIIERNNYILINDNNNRYNMIDNNFTKKIVNNNNKNEIINNYYIKSYKPEMTSIYNINLNLNLKTQHNINKSENKNKNNINTIFSQNNLKSKKSMKSDVLIRLKKNINNMNKYIHTIQLKKNTPKININKLNNNNITINKKSINQINFEKINNNKWKHNYYKNELLCNSNIPFITINHSKNTIENNLNLNNEISENLTERKIYNKEMTVSNINDSYNSYINSCIRTNQNRQLFPFKTKIVLHKKNPQKKWKNEDRSQKNKSSKIWNLKMALSNVKNFCENPQKKHTYDILKKTIYNPYNIKRNNKNKELASKKYSKSNIINNYY